MNKPYIIQSTIASSSTRSHITDHDIRVDGRSMFDRFTFCTQVKNIPKPLEQAPYIYLLIKERYMFWYILFSSPSSISRIFGIV